jgi:hypothetical protein
MSIASSMDCYYLKSMINETLSEKRREMKNYLGKKNFQDFS